MVGKEQYEKALQLCGDANAPDHSLPLALLQEAAEAEYPPAIYALGSWYVHGKGVEQDAVRAFELFKKAADLGYGPAEYDVAVSYELGTGVEACEDLAFEYYLRAAEDGDLDGQTEVARCYYYGIGTARDSRKALEWYRKAAESGDSESQYFLGRAYEFGEGVSPDFAVALNWYQKAAHGGNSDAAKAYKALKALTVPTPIDAESTTLKYHKKAISDFDTLLKQSFDLKSPLRSTVPLLAYWSNTNRLAEFREATGLPLPLQGATLAFEYQVAPLKGRGNPSHTDLMIISPPVAVAIEAKYTELRYPVVSDWLRANSSTNRRAVLDGWLDIINRACGSGLSDEMVMDLSYQLIHRTASVCQLPVQRRAVVYHYFDPVDELRDYYSAQLNQLAEMIGAAEPAFFLYMTTLGKSAAYAELQARWLAEGKPDFGDEVRQLLGENNIANYSRPVVWKCEGPRRRTA